MLVSQASSERFRGIENSGGTGQIIELCREKIESCLTCDDGRGECIHENRCVIDNRLLMLLETLKEAYRATHQSCCGGRLQRQRNGFLLSELETWCRHVSAVPFERIGITRYNRDQMLIFIEWAGANMVAFGTQKNSGASRI